MDFASRFYLVVACGISKSSKNIHVFILTTTPFARLSR
jgi:hypothetical protein